MATRSSAASPGEKRALRVNNRLAIPRDELVVRATRASGAGGQHVNKTSTRVEITWNVLASQALDDADRARISARLSSRLSDDGELRVVASDTRSQLQNRELAEARLADLVRRALVVPKPRKKTRPSRAAKQARLDDKRRTSDKKRVRRSNTDE
ncbi:MAG: alternative ribosome rescue aminoacyl-tRNA hydrolase ArfB [Gemmatimonadaceae bacterium]